MVLCWLLCCGQLLYYFYQLLLRFCCNGATNAEKVIRFSFMSGVCQINIVESAPTLKALLAQQKTASGKERVQALYLLKTRQVETVQGLAGCLGRDRVTVQRWLRQYRQGGLEKLLTVGKSKGRPKVIPDWAIKRLQQELCDPEGFDSYKEVQIWLEAVLGIKANYHNDIHIIQLDNGSFHKAKRLKVPGNILLLFQPPHCPKLNPIDRLWEYLKGLLSWSLFSNLEALRTQVRKLLNSFKKEVIDSLAGWEYILRALSVAAI